MKAEMRDSPYPRALWRSLLWKPASAARSGSEDRPLPLAGRRIRALHSGGAAGVAVMQAAQPLAIGVHQRCPNGRLDLADAQV